MRALGLPAQAANAGTLLGGDYALADVPEWVIAGR
jgi:hypothetical protein